MPAWVSEGYEEYARRLPPECRLHLTEVAPGARTKGADLARSVRDEGVRMLGAIPKDTLVIALDARGVQWDTETLSQQLELWLGGGRDITLLVGGPEGLADNCLERAEQVWSLSKLTLPHPLVRIVLAEQIYRAWSILKKHPYHR